MTEVIQRIRAKVEWHFAVYFEEKQNALAIQLIDLSIKTDFEQLQTL